MNYPGESIVIEQLKDLEPLVPVYDYSGLYLPAGLTVNAYFGSHEDPRDLDGTKALIDAHDIVVYENFDCDARSLDLIQKVSKGNYAAREKMLRQLQTTGNSKAWTDQQTSTMKAFYNMRKPLLVIDPERGHPIEQKISKLYSMPNRLSIDLVRAIEEHKVKTVGLAEANLERENFMLRGLCEQVNNTVEANPKLSAKQKQEGVSVVLLDFGLAHSGLYYGIQEVARRSGSEINASVHISSGAELIDYRVQAMDRYVYGFEVDDLLIAKDLITRVKLNRTVAKEDRTNTPVLVAATNQVMHQIDDLDIQQLKELYSTIPRG